MRPGAGRAGTPPEGFVPFAARPRLARSRPARRTGGVTHEQAVVEEVAMRRRRISCSLCRSTKISPWTKPSLSEVRGVVASRRAWRRGGVATRGNGGGAPLILLPVGNACTRAMRKISFLSPPNSFTHATHRVVHHPHPPLPPFPRFRDLARLHAVEWFRGERQRHHRHE